MHYNHISGQRFGRIEALSDGVFAIAMTILVFNLQFAKDHPSLTDDEMWAELKSMAPGFLSFFLSFLTLGIFWIGHSTQFHFITKSDRKMSWISIFFLMFVSLLPFTSDVLSHHIENRFSIALYWLNILVMGVMLYVHWGYAERKGLLSGESLQEATRAIKRRIIIAQSLYALGALMCFVNTYLSLFFIVAVQLNYAFGIIASKHKHHAHR
ncbi:MAG: TMEM175 family protein [Flavobacteriales bacterium]